MIRRNALLSEGATMCPDGAGGGTAKGACGGR